ncbi:MAG: hypothetical protein ISN28_02290 [Ectothiorhodospiraceae bacterium AqS1]|nr:hypothetical protein [Ectothiorhodospiraceae bacterium AqS1]
MMNKDIALIADRINRKCHVTKCKSRGCSVSLEGMPHPSERLIVNMDCRELHIQNDMKRCDYLVFIDDSSGDQAGRILAISIEMKNEKVCDITHIMEQIKRGIEIAEQWMPEGASSCFIAVLVHNGIDKQSAKKLAESPIRISGVNHFVRPIRCRSCLKDALKQ